MEWHMRDKRLDSMTQNGIEFDSNYADVPSKIICNIT